MNVSVIIPLYNKGSHIQRAIDSVLAQTYTDFELIVVDDGSTDGSTEILQAYTDARIRPIMQENAGASAARNHGIAEARTELVAFLDADDEWHKDFLESALSLREQFPEAAVWGTAYGQIMANGESVPITLCKELWAKRDGLLIDFFRESLVQQPCNCSSMLVDRGALQKVGGFRTGLVWLEDTDLLFRLALRHPIAYLPQIKSLYHMEAQNRASQVVFSGNNPFATEAREFSRSQRNKERIEDMPAAIQQYIGHYQSAALYSNWLAGNRQVLLQIVRDCRRIRGYRMKCLLWWCLAWVPAFWLSVARRAYYYSRGQVPFRLCIRNTFRTSTALSRCRADSVAPVSIVIPLYNKAPYICRALSSVLRQTIQDFECIVVDDGSTDGGEDIVQGMKDPRIRLVRQPNSGVSLARNRGIELARYPLIAFLDADDEWMPGFLEASLRMHQEHPHIVASFTNYQQQPEGTPAFCEAAPGPRVLKDYFAFCLCHRGRGMWSSAVMARRDTLLRIGGFPAGRTLGEDLDTWARLAWSGPIAFVPDPLSFYHQECGASKAGTANLDVMPTCREWLSMGRIPARLTRSSLAFATLCRCRTVFRLAQAGEKLAAMRLYKDLAAASRLSPLGLASFMSIVSYPAGKYAFYATEVLNRTLGRWQWSARL